MASPFGQNTGGFSFNKPAFGTPSQPASSPGLFGSSFGASTPAFGASSAPAFGAFGAASTPAFGAASTPAFGAASTPSLGFGQASTGFSFSTATTPAAKPFGAASTPAFGFSGFGAASSPGFGANATPAFGASTSSLFGASSASAFGATGGLFGSTSAPAFGASSSSLFGSTSAPAFGSTGGAFGSMITPSSGGLFGNTTQMAPVSYSTGMPGAGPPTDAAIKEISEIRGAYTPSSAAYKFQYLFLNVVDNPAQRVKPANVDELRWRQALAQAGGQNNPDRLWPVLASGFKDLLARAAAQQQAIEENQQRLRNLNDLGHRLARKHSTELKQRAGDVQKRHMELSHRLLHVTRLLDALESRLASSIGYRGDLARAKEQDLSRHLAVVEAEASPASASGLLRRLEAVGAAARLRVGASQLGGAASAQLDERSLQQLFVVLKEHAEAVKQLQNVLRKDQMDLQVIRQHYGAGVNGESRMME